MATIVACICYVFVGHEGECSPLSSHSFWMSFASTLPSRCNQVTPRSDGGLDCCLPQLSLLDTQPRCWGWEMVRQKQGCRCTLHSCSDPWLGCTIALLVSECNQCPQSDHQWCRMEVRVVDKVMIGAGGGSISLSVYAKLPMST